MAVSFKTVFLTGTVLATIPLVSASAQPTNESSAVMRSIRSELGHLRGDYGDVVEPAWGPVIVELQNAEPVERLADGNYLLAGCRMHSCGEKAAVIVRPDGSMVAAGLINLHCGAVYGCLERTVLTILVKRKNDRPAVRQILQEWADGEMSNRSL